MKHLKKFEGYYDPEPDTTILFDDEKREKIIQYENIRTIYK